MNRNLVRQRPYGNAGMCCSTEENHENFTLALPGYKLEAGNATLPCTVCRALLQLVNTQRKTDYGVPTGMLVKVQLLGLVGSCLLVSSYWCIGRD